MRYSVYPVLFGEKITIDCWKQKAFKKETFLAIFLFSKILPHERARIFALCSLHQYASFELSIIPSKSTVMENNWKKCQKGPFLEVIGKSIVILCQNAEFFVLHSADQGISLEISNVTIKWFFFTFILKIICLYDCHSIPNPNTRYNQIYPTHLIFSASQGWNFT